MAPTKRRSGTTSYGHSEKRDFHVYDKVFARMRGYPPWPAKITSIQVDPKNKSLKHKCEVQFYGTNQLGLCAFADIHDYEANKERFEKCCQTAKHKASFAKALEEIEADNGPLLEEMMDGSVAKISFDDDEEEKEEKRGVKRKTGNSDGEEDKSGFDAEEWSEDESANDEKLTPVSGRVSSSKKQTPVTRKSAPSPAAEAEEMPTSSSSEKQASTIDAAAEGESSKTLVKCSAETRKAMNANKLKASEVHKTTPRPQKSWTEMLKENDIQADLSSPSTQPGEEVKTTIKSELRTECTLLALEAEIKDSLCLHRADFDRAILAMEGIAELRLTSVMLLKHPQVFDSYRKLKVYFGDKVKRTLPQSQWKAFESRATQVRDLAAQTLEKQFPALFQVPSGMTFTEHYRDELVWFLHRTATMTSREMLSLTTHDDL